MCSATLGATPVYFWTTAASAIFSSGFRGTPGWLNTLNRVPEFPKAHEGSSISWRRRAAFTASVVMVQSPSGGRFDAARWKISGSSRKYSSGGRPSIPVKNSVISGLPAGVDLGGRHRLLRSVQVLGFDVPDQQAV